MYLSSLLRNRREVMGGTVFILKVEKNDLIDGELQQECSLVYASNCVNENPKNFLKIM